MLKWHLNWPHFFGKRFQAAVWATKHGTNTAFTLQSITINVRARIWLANAAPCQMTSHHVEPGSAFVSYLTLSIKTCFTWIRHCHLAVLWLVQSDECVCVLFDWLSMRQLKFKYGPGSVHNVSSVWRDECVDILSGLKDTLTVFLSRLSCDHLTTHSKLHINFLLRYARLLSP